MISDIQRILSSKVFRGSIRYNEPMSRHTSFRVGGPADLFVRPQDVQDVAELVHAARTAGEPLFVLGAGANILVADRGVRGVVVDLSAFDYTVIGPAGVRAGAGTAVTRVSEYAADRSLSGLEFIYSMPGSVGGSVWMNARCYGRSLSERLSYVDLVDESGRPQRITPKPHEFDYKRSPFQNQRCVIVEAGFALEKGRKDDLWASMLEHYNDRCSKGHFDAPSVGSIFKNNRDFGRPSGALIDSLGLKGFTIGGAAVSSRHANIIINRRDATAVDVRRLIEHVESRVEAELGLKLEREVIFVGDWGPTRDEPNG